VIADAPERGSGPKVANRLPLRRLVGVLLALVVAALWTFYVVQPPGAAGPALGPSWQLGITIAAREHVQFGRDIVFTYGPLGYVLDGIAEPRLAASSIAIKLLLMLIVVIGAWSLFATSTSPLQRLAFAGALGVLSAPLPFDYLILLGTVALLARASRFPRCAPLIGVAVGVTALFGLLSKYTLAVDVLGAAAATWIVDLARGPLRRRRAALVAGSIAVTLTAVGTAAAMNLSPSAIADYLRGAAAISAGYSAAMTSDGPRSQVALALVVAAAILATGVAAWREGKPTLAPLAAVVLFSAWKHGFVRQDSHITLYFGTAAGLATMLFVAARRLPARVLGLGASMLAIAAFLFAFDSTRDSTAQLVTLDRIPIGARYVFSPIATQTRIAALIPEQLAPDALPPSLLVSIQRSTVDVLPSETSIVAANALHWDPLPVFQSYSAYTPFLDGLNRTALVERGAASILYDYAAAIDARYPLGEMPATMVEIACRYRAVSPALYHVGPSSYALLRRESANGCTTFAAADAVDVAVGRPTIVPAPRSAAEFIVARFALRPTAFTALATVLWRAPPAFLDVTFADRTTKRWRLVTGTAGDGMIVSPAPRNPAEAAAFFGGAALAPVRSVTISSRPGAYILDAVRFTRMDRSWRP